MAAIVGSVFFVVNFAVAVFGAPKKTATNLPVFTLVWVVCVRECWRNSTTPTEPTAIIG